MDALGRPNVEEFKNIPKIPVTILLDDTRSMHNVGSVFRSSDAFLVEEIILCGITPTPPHRDIHKAALGAEESVTWKHSENAAQTISDKKKEHYTILAIEQTDSSQQLEKFRPDCHQKYVVVFGNEVFGVKDELLALCDDVIEIPQGGTKHSLNVSVCAGIVLWEFYKVYTAN